MFGFPVPVSNQSIPRGWFAALVRFMNSLLLRGDGRYFAVTHTTEGTTINPTPALIQALERSGGAAPSAGGAGTSYGIEAVIDGSTASIALVPGSTVSSLSLVPTAPVTLTSGANGELIIGSTASGGGMSWPDYLNGGSSVEFDTSYTANSGGWLIGNIVFVSSIGTISQISSANIVLYLIKQNPAESILLGETQGVVSYFLNGNPVWDFCPKRFYYNVLIPPGYTFRLETGSGFTWDLSEFKFYQST